MAAAQPPAAPEADDKRTYVMRCVYEALCDDKAPSYAPVFVPDDAPEVGPPTVEGFEEARTPRESVHAIKGYMKVCKAAFEAQGHGVGYATESKRTGDEGYSCRLRHPESGKVARVGYAGTISMHMEGMPGEPARMTQMKHATPFAAEKQASQWAAEKGLKSYAQLNDSWFFTKDAVPSVKPLPKSAGKSSKLTTGVVVKDNMVNILAMNEKSDLALGAVSFPDAAKAKQAAEEMRKKLLYVPRITPLSEKDASIESGRAKALMESGKSRMAVSTSTGKEGFAKRKAPRAASVAGTAVSDPGAVSTVSGPSAAKSGAGASKPGKHYTMLQALKQNAADVAARRLAEYTTSPDWIKADSLESLMSTMTVPSYMQVMFHNMHTNAQKGDIASIVRNMLAIKTVIRQGALKAMPSDVYFTMATEAEREQRGGQYVDALTEIVETLSLIHMYWQINPPSASPGLMFADLSDMNEKMAEWVQRVVGVSYAYEETLAEAKEPEMIAVTAAAALRSLGETMVRHAMQKQGLHFSDHRLVGVRNPDGGGPQPPAGTLADRGGNAEALAPRGNNPLAQQRLVYLVWAMYTQRLENIMHSFESYKLSIQADGAADVLRNIVSDSMPGIKAALRRRTADVVAFVRSLNRERRALFGSVEEALNLRQAADASVQQLWSALMMASQLRGNRAEDGFVVPDGITGNIQPMITGSRLFNGAEELTWENQAARARGLADANLDAAWDIVLGIITTSLQDIMKKAIPSDLKSIARMANLTDVYTPQIGEEFGDAFQGAEGQDARLAMQMMSVMTMIRRRILDYMQASQQASEEELREARNFINDVSVKLTGIIGRTDAAAATTSARMALQASEDIAASRQQKARIMEDEFSRPPGFAHVASARFGGVGYAGSSLYDAFKTSHPLTILALPGGINMEMDINDPSSLSDMFMMNSSTIIDGLQRHVYANMERSQLYLPHFVLRALDREVGCRRFFKVQKITDEGYTKSKEVDREYILRAHYYAAMATLFMLILTCDPMLLEYFINAEDVDKLPEDVQRAEDSKLKAKVAEVAGQSHTGSSDVAYGTTRLQKIKMHLMMNATVREKQDTGYAKISWRKVMLEYLSKALSVIWKTPLSDLFHTLHTTVNVTPIDGFSPGDIAARLQLFALRVLEFRNVGDNPVSPATPRSLSLRGCFDVTDVTRRGYDLEDLTIVIRNLRRSPGVDVQRQSIIFEPNPPDVIEDANEEQAKNRKYLLSIPMLLAAIQVQGDVPLGAVRYMPRTVRPLHSLVYDTENGPDASGAIHARVYMPLDKVVAQPANRAALFGTMYPVGEGEEQNRAREIAELQIQGYENVGPILANLGLRPLFLRPRVKIDALAPYVINQRPPAVPAAAAGAGAGGGNPPNPGDGAAAVGVGPAGGVQEGKEQQ